MSKSYRHQTVMLQVEFNSKHSTLASTAHIYKKKKKTEGDTDGKIPLSYLIQLTE